MKATADLIHEHTNVLFPMADRLVPEGAKAAHAAYCPWPAFFRFL